MLLLIFYIKNIVKYKNYYCAIIKKNTNR